MNRRYATVDVFTQQVFGGNPLAVVLDAQGLTTAQMQSIAREFNYAETTFVLPPRTPGHSAQVRIFTPCIEVPFAGHPNVGTAVVLARELHESGKELPTEFVFEEGAGPVHVRLLRDGGMVVGAELTAPERLAIGATVSSSVAAACLGIEPSEIDGTVHSPCVASVGLPFLVAQVVSREVLGRCTPQIEAHRRVLPSLGTDTIYVYARGDTAGELHARAFAPLDGVPEDPATGSATAAALALLASLGADGETAWRVEQGVQMGRPSLLLGRTEKRSGSVAAVHVAGYAVPVMQGVLRV